MSTSPPTALYADLPARLKAAAERVAETAEAARLARLHRNQLIVTAVDLAGMSQGAVARLCDIRQPHVIRIVADPDNAPVKLGDDQGAAA